MEVLRVVRWCRARCWVLRHCMPVGLVGLLVLPDHCCWCFWWWWWLVGVLVGWWVLVGVGWLG